MACTTSLCSRSNHTASLLSKFWPTTCSLKMGAKQHKFHSSLTMNRTSHWNRLHQTVTLSMIPLLLWASLLTGLPFHHKVLSHICQIHIIPLTILMDPRLAGLPLSMMVMDSGTYWKIWRINCWGLNLMMTSAVAPSKVQATKHIPQQVQIKWWKRAPA